MGLSGLVTDRTSEWMRWRRGVGNGGMYKTEHQEMGRKRKLRLVCLQPAITHYLPGLPATPKTCSLTPGLSRKLDLWDTCGPCGQGHTEEVPWECDWWSSIQKGWGWLWSHPWFSCNPALKCSTREDIPPLWSEGQSEEECGVEHGLGSNGLFTYGAFFFFFFLVFIYLAAPGFCRGIRALVPSLGMEPGPLAPGVLIPGPPGKSCFWIF